MTAHDRNTASWDDSPIQRLRAVLRTLRFAAPAERRRLEAEALELEVEILRRAGRERRATIEIPEGF